MRFVYVSVVPEASLSPILVRPVREQLEHDRVIRLLQQDLAKKKVEVDINPGAEQNASVGAGRKEFPDAVLYSTEKGRKLVGVIEVETTESVNHLEAMSQWAHLAKLKVPFHLYVPTGSVDVARRLSEDHHISVTEIWSYLQVGEQFKFTLIYPPARGRSAATAPRTISVASIRVEPRVDPTVADVPDAPAARSAASKAERAPVAPRVIPTKPKVIPSKVAAKAAAPAKVVVPPKSAVAKAAAPVKVAAAVKVAAVTVAAAVKVAAVKVASAVKAAAPVKAVPAAAAAKIPKPASKAPVVPVAKAKPVPPGNAKAAANVTAAARPVARPPVPARPAAKARPAAPPARKPVARGKAAAPARAPKAKPAPARKPASKRR
jgi:hypothetical protein